MKMNTASKNPVINLRPQQQIRGKWHHKSYTVIRRLGAGAIGSVYLCDYLGKPVALKISEKGSSMTVEVNVLKSLEKVQGYRLGPSLLDVDDWMATNGRIYSFYVMEYIKGESLSSFVRAKGKAWIGVFMLQLLEDLEKLHESGWVFGDLKTDNLMVSSKPPRVRWVDVGGTTKVGRSIKEYTEFYDRGYWGMGTRKAEPSYDLFALAMVFLNIYYPRRFDRVKDSSEKLLMKKLDQVSDLTPYRPLLQKAIRGKYTTSTAMKKDLLSLMQQKQKRKHYHQRSKKTSNYLLVESISIGCIATVYYLLSLLL
ncbi:serine/threonine protein kinase [Oceanobacillus sp. 1P07AA]|uniref:serine/threonine protein kinase n=1 Tax=Oceanobacillus sp. 1P07AA TaxID=3132293 RepID=UPI0039A5B470